jgi:hypothetical protein
MFKTRGLSLSGCAKITCLLCRPPVFVPACCVWHCIRYFNLSGAHALLATNNGPGVVAAYTLSQMPPEKGLRACANLAGLVPPGEPGGGG